MSVIIDNKYRWFEQITDGVKLFVIGGSWYKDNYYEGEQLCNLFINLFLIIISCSIVFIRIRT